MLSHAQRIRHNRQRRIHRRTRNKEAAVYHVKVIHVVRLAIHVERRRFRISAETNRAVLMSYTRERNAFGQNRLRENKP